MAWSYGLFRYLISVSGQKQPTSYKLTTVPSGQSRSVAMQAIL